LKFRRIAPLLVLFAASLAPAPARADARSELQALYNRGLQSYRKGNPDFLINLQTPDFTMKLPDGRTINRRQANAQIRNSIQAFKKLQPGRKPPTIDTRVLGVASRGNQAVATVASSATFSTKDAQGKSHTIRSVSTERHTWVKTPKGWRVRRVEALKTNTTVNGKPVGMPAMPAPARR
jgi:hypothetical protein